MTINEPETNPNNPSGAPSEPFQPLSGATLDTTGADFVAPLSGEHLSPADDAVLQVTDLTRFLEARFPDQVVLTNRQVPERPVDVAMRLLESLASNAPDWRVARCGMEYCNKPAGHTDEHGWIQAD